MRHPAFSLLFLWCFRRKAVILSAVMNWKFILSWGIKFALCTFVYSWAAGFTNSAWWAFAMALGFLIIIAIFEGYVIDWIEKLKERKGHAQ